MVLRSFCALVPLALILPSARCAPTARPNIIVIMADDLGWDDVGYHGSQIRTPNIDGLARRGLRLERYHTYPTCAPTRAAFLTGRSSLRTGVDRVGLSLPLSESTLAQQLQSAGYQTFLVGKWHLGNSGDYLPHKRGFDHFYGFAGGGTDYFTRAPSRSWQRNGKLIQDKGYATHLFTDQAVRLIEERDKSQPFFLFLCYNAGHTPLQAPAEYLRKYKHIADLSRRTFAAMIDAMDDGIGRVVAAVNKAAIAPHTLIVFVSDNGGGRAGSNFPLRGGKGSLFGGGTHVPCVVYWPGRVSGGKKLAQQVAVQDWLPTLVAAADVPLKTKNPLDGQNMWPAISQGKKVARRDLIISGRSGRCIFRGKWKLVVQTRGRGQPMLFDTNSDPLEINDLAAKHPQVVETLRAAFEDRPAAANNEKGRRSRLQADRAPVASQAPTAESKQAVQSAIAYSGDKKESVVETVR